MDEVHRAAFDLGPQSVSNFETLTHELFGHLWVGEVAVDLIKELCPVVERSAESIRKANVGRSYRLEIVASINNPPEGARASNSTNNKGPTSKNHQEENLIGDA